MRSYVAVSWLGCVVLSNSVCHGQIEERIAKENIESAQELAAELIARRSELPIPWSAKQTRTLINVARLQEALIFQESIEEINSFDTEERVQYSRILKGTGNANDPFGTDGIQRFASDKEILVRIKGRAWQVVDKIPHLNAPATDPFNWCMGFVNSARIGTLGEDHLATIFYGLKRECLKAWKNKDGELVSFWGRLEKQRSPIEPQMAFQVVFDTQRRTIVRYALLSFEQEVTLEKIAKGKFDVIESGKVTWKPHTVRGKEKLEMLLPVRVRLLSVMNPGEDIECVNTIQWLLGDNVPKSAFIDPRKSGFAEPTFPPLDEKDFEALERKP